MLQRDSTDLRDTCTVVAGPRGVTAEFSGRRFTLNAVPVPAPYHWPTLYEPSFPDYCDRVRHALVALHREHRFDCIEFTVHGGLGFRTIQAKRAGLAFHDVTLAVRLDSCGAWEREQSQRWPSGYDEIELDFAERYSFENADERTTPDAELLRFVECQGWRTAVAGLCEARPGSQTPATVGSPLVTLAIAHHNLGRYLPDALASLAAQTYSPIEVIVIDDGSTDAHSLSTFEAMRQRYPRWRFLTQTNAGIGATRNRCLELATGEFFIPVDADNLARPEMVERFVAAIRRNPHLSAMSCYFLAFEGDTATPTRFIHANRPTGGPHVLSCIRNVYGDANAIFRTTDLRAIGGYETDRGTSCEDWEAFVKLVHAGKRIGVVPDHLFYYRHRPGGFSRSTNWYANHRRVLRQFARLDPMPTGEGDAPWTALLGFHQRLQQLESVRPPRRHRLMDALYSPLVRLKQFLFA